MDCAPRLRWPPLLLLALATLGCARPTTSAPPPEAITSTSVAWSEPLFVRRFDGFFHLERNNEIHLGERWVDNTNRDAITIVGPAVMALSLAPRRSGTVRYGVLGLGGAQLPRWFERDPRAQVDVFEDSEDLMALLGSEVQPPELVQLGPRTRLRTPATSRGPAPRYDVLIESQALARSTPLSERVQVERLRKVARLLGTDGVFMGSIPLTNVSPAFIRRMLATYLAVFPHVAMVRTHVLSDEAYVVASPRPFRFDLDTLAELHERSVSDAWMLFVAGFDRRTDVASRLIFRDTEDVRTFIEEVSPLSSVRPYRANDAPSPSEHAPFPTSAPRHGRTRLPDKQRWWRNFADRRFLRATRGDGWRYGVDCLDRCSALRGVRTPHDRLELALSYAAARRVSVAERVLALGAGQGELTSEARVRQILGWIRTPVFQGATPAARLAELPPLATVAPPDFPPDAMREVEIALRGVRQGKSPLMTSVLLRRAAHPLGVLLWEYLRLYVAAARHGDVSVSFEWLRTEHEPPAALLRRIGQLTYFQFPSFALVCFEHAARIERGDARWEGQWVPRRQLR